MASIEDIFSMFEFDTSLLNKNQKLMLNLQINRYVSVFNIQNNLGNLSYFLKNNNKLMLLIKDLFTEYSIFNACDQDDQIKLFLKIKGRAPFLINNCFENKFIDKYNSNLFSTIMCFVVTICSKEKFEESFVWDTACYVTFESMKNNDIAENIVNFFKTKFAIIFEHIENQKEINQN